MLGTKSNELTARRLKTEYLQKLQNLAAVGGENVQPTVKTLPLKIQGRPLLLGVELDQAVQEYITSLRAIGGVVNTAIVMAAAKGIVSTRDASKLTSHGGHIEITSTWAKSLLSRMGYVKRKCSNAGKVSTPLFKNVFLADMTAEVIMNNIPDNLIIIRLLFSLCLLVSGRCTSQVKRWSQFLTLTTNVKLRQYLQQR